MNVPSRGLSVVLALAFLTSCSVADIRRPPPPPSATVAPGVAQPTRSAAASNARHGSANAEACSRKTQVSGLLKPDDVWPPAEQDATAQAGYHVSESCDQGPPWPTDCAGLWGALSFGWPGNRTEGVYYSAVITVLNVSGAEVTEQLLLFGTPGSNGLRLVVDQAKACEATAGQAVSGARVYRLPPQRSVQRVLVVDRMAAIRLDAPSGFAMDRLIRTAVKRARSV